MPQPISTIHMSLGFASGTLICFLFQPEVLDAKGNRGLAGALPVPAKGGHVGGEGVVGEHQEITAHPLVALDGRERARGGLATAAGGGGGLLRWWRCSGDLPPRLSVREMRSTTRRAMWHIQ